MTPQPQLDRLREALPENAGICAYDIDECTVTVALDSEADVRGLVSMMPSRNRVALVAAVALRNGADELLDENARLRAVGDDAIEALEAVKISYGPPCEGCQMSASIADMALEKLRTALHPKQERDDGTG